MPSNFETLVFEIIAKDAQASAAFDRFRQKVDQTSRSVDAASKATDRNAASLTGVAAAAEKAAPSLGTIVTPMAGMVAAGVALSPVLVTLGLGFGGLAVAALGMAKNQNLVKQSLGPLKAEVAGFQRTLQPVVMYDFAKATHLAGGFLHDLEPVTRATGIALGSMLGQVDAEFRSQRWQSFFGWMGRTAPGDMKLLTDSLVHLMDALPPLLRDLQPVAETILKLGDAGARSINVLAVAWDKLQTKAAGERSTSIFGEISRGVTWLEAHTPAGHKSFLDLAEGALGIHHAADKAGMSLQAMGSQAQATRQQVSALTTAQTKAIDVMLGYSNALITQKNDALSLAQALQASSGRVGLQTVAQRASFSAANTYIADLENTAKQAIASGHGIGAQISAIQQALPLLDSAKTKNRLYWEEVRALKIWLDKLRQERIDITVDALGSWSVSHANIGSAGPHAAGGIIRGPGTGTSDSIAAWLSSGEYVVKAAAVAQYGTQLLDAINAQRFAGGGIAGSYKDGIAGISPWLHRENAATINAIAASVASSFAAALRAGGTGQGNLGTAEQAWMGAGGPGGLWAHIAGAITGAESGFRANAVQQGQPYATTGWGPWQITPGNSEPQYGTDYGLLNWRSNALAAVAKFRQAGGSFSPWTTFGSGAYLQFMDRGGVLAPGANLVWNATGRSEALVPAGAGNREMTQLLGAVLVELRKLNRTSERTSRRTGAAVADRLNGAARAALHQGMYSARGGR